MIWCNVNKIHYDKKIFPVNYSELSDKGIWKKQLKGRLRLGCFYVTVILSSDWGCDWGWGWFETEFEVRLSWGWDWGWCWDKVKLKFSWSWVELG